MHSCRKEITPGPQREPILSDKSTITKRWCPCQSISFHSILCLNYAALSFFRHFQQKKEFSSSVPHKSGVEELSGVVTLTDYKTLEKTDGYIEEMKGYGLTEEEILLKLQYEEREASVCVYILLEAQELSGLSTDLLI